MEDTTKSNKRCKRVYIKGHVWSRSKKIRCFFYAKPSFRFILVQNGKTDTNLRLEKGKVGGTPVYGKGQGFTEREVRILED